MNLLDHGCDRILSRCQRDRICVSRRENSDRIPSRCQRDRMIVLAISKRASASSLVVSAIALSRKLYSG